ncbi:MAG: hypothetical protein P4L96_19620 [Rhodoferax sp.]|nr:hypothetical protein [Rhodoferax sp.]
MSACHPRRAAKRVLAMAAAGPLMRRWEVLSTDPIRNPITVYGCVMAAATGTYECGATTTLPVDGRRLRYADGASLPHTHFV